MFFRIRIENMNKYGSMVRCRFSKFELMIDFNLVNLFKEICWGNLVSNIKKIIQFMRIKELLFACVAWRNCYQKLIEE